MIRKVCFLIDLLQYHFVGVGLVLCACVRWVSVWATVRPYRAYVDGLCLHVIGCVVRYRIYVVE